MHIENQANSPPKIEQVTTSITRRVHIENQANSPSEREQDTVCHQKGAYLAPGQLTGWNVSDHNLCHQKSAIKIQVNSPPVTRQATVCVTRRVHIKIQANSLAEIR